MIERNNIQGQTTDSPQQGQVAKAWDSIAAEFDRFLTPPNIALGKDALEIAGLEADMRFLDVAAGSGALSIPGARRGAEVLAVDLSPEMVDHLRARARKEGLHNVEARVMDAYQLELQDDAFDMAGSQNGVSLLPDLLRALREMARVTKPGGRVMVVAFGPLAEAEFLTFFMRGMQLALPGFDGPPWDGPPLPFQVADPEKLRRVMADAGLTDVRVEESTWKFELRSGDDLWRIVTNSNPIGGEMVTGLADRQKAAVLEALDELLAERAGGSGLAVLTNAVNVGVGTCQENGSPGWEV